MIIRKLDELLLNIYLVWGRIRKIAWHGNSQGDVLIYDDEGSDLLMHCIPFGAKVNILKVRGGIPIINSRYFFKRFFVNLLQQREIKSALLKSLFDVWKPKVVITFIDNSISIRRVKVLFPDIPVICVQNGIRWDMARKDCLRLHFDYYYCFGLAEQELIDNLGHSANFVEGIGSIRLGISGVESKVFDKGYDICFISEYVPFISLQEQTDKWTKDFLIALNTVEKSLYELVSKFAKLNNLTICVAMRSASTSQFYDEELNFFLNTADPIVDMLPRKGLSSYSAVKKSSLTVCAFSTLGYEALGMGSRVIFAADVKLLKNKLMDDDGLQEPYFLTHQLLSFQRLHLLSYEEFSHKAKLLLQFTNDDYLKCTDAARKYYMNNNSARPQEVIEKKIQSFL